MTNEEMRARAGLSIDAMSRLAGLTPQMIKAFEAGGDVGVPAAVRLARIYGDGLTALLAAAGVTR